MTATNEVAREQVTNWGRLIHKELALLLDHLEPLRSALDGRVRLELCIPLVCGHLVGGHAAVRQLPHVLVDTRLLFSG